MRILHITAGTGGFYCGTCIRDNGLVRALRTLGHDAQLVPLYLPVVAEGDDMSEGQDVWFGGINVYLQQLVPALRHVPMWMDRPLDARPLLILVAHRAGFTKPEDVGELTVSMLAGEAGNQVKEIERLLRELERQPPPDLVVLSNALLAGLAAPLRRRLGVPVVVTFQGEIHFIDALGPRWTPAAWEALGVALEGADFCVAVSRFARDRMAARLGIDPRQIAVVENGIDLDGFPDTPRPEPEVPCLGFLARISHENGADLLLESFLRLTAGGARPTLRLEIAGTANGADVALVQELRARASEAGMADRVTVRTNLSRDEKLAVLNRASVMCVPARRAKTGSLSLLEAMAAGVPVVAPDRGVARELLRDTGAGVLVVPDDEGALDEAMGSLLAQPRAREAMAAAGHAAARIRFGEVRMARDLVRVCERRVSSAQSQATG